MAGAWRYSCGSGGAGGGAGDRVGRRGKGLSGRGQQQ